MITILAVEHFSFNKKIHQVRFPRPSHATAVNACNRTDIVAGNTGTASERVRQGIGRVIVARRSRRSAFLRVSRVNGPLSAGAHVRVTQHAA